VGLKKGELTLKAPPKNVGIQTLNSRYLYSTKEHESHYSISDFQKNCPEL
jgi:hypothetical protein